MYLKYILNKDINNRVATKLSWSINELESAVYIIKDERSINAKSLLGLLCGDLRSGNIIEIKFTYSYETEKIIEIFNEVGGKV